MTLWASRSGTLLDDEGDPNINKATKLTGPATVGGGNIPALHYGGMVSHLQK